MMMRLLMVALLGYILLLCSCAKLEKDHAEAVFFIENKEAVMPVWVCGNPESDTYVLILHGGPGMGSFGMVQGFAALEQRYRCVYWDQRGAGSSLGNPSAESFRLAQYVEDLELLVAVLRAKYDMGSLFLLGHSWGGAVGTAYLLKEENQAAVDGWIDVGGGHNIVRGHQLSWQAVKGYAEQQVASGNDSRYWKKAVRWYDENRRFDGDNFLQHDRYTVKAKGVYADLDHKPDLEPVFFNSPYSVVTSFSNAAHSIKNSDFFTIDLSEQMQVITVPAQVIWGRKDMCMPPAMAEEAHRSLGTPPGGKEPIVYLDESAHFPFYEEPEAFTAAVVNFVEKYR